MLQALGCCERNDKTKAFDSDGGFVVGFVWCGWDLVGVWAFVARFGFFNTKLWQC